MSELREALGRLLWRALLAAPFFCGGALLLHRADGGFAAAGTLLFGMALLLLGALILAFPIAQIMAEPSGSLYYPGGRLPDRSPMYGTAEAKAKKGLYEEAMAAYEKIAQEFPNELKPHVEMIGIAAVHLNDLPRAERIYDYAAATLQSEDARQALARMYAAIRSLEEGKRRAGDVVPIHLAKLRSAPGRTGRERRGD